MDIMHTKTTAEQQNQAVDHGTAKARAVANHAHLNLFHKRFGLELLDQTPGEWAIYDNQSWVRADGSSPLHDRIRDFWPGSVAGYSPDDSAYSAATLVRLPGVTEDGIRAVVWMLIRQALDVVIAERRVATAE